MSDRKRPIGGGGARHPNSLRNLPNLKGELPAGTWPPGASPHLSHGLRSVRPPAIVLSPLVAEIEAALADDLPIKAADGSVPAPDRFAVELAAIALLRVRRCFAFLELKGDVDERGNLRPELDGLGKAVEYAARMLDRLGMSPRARAALGVDVARASTFSLAQHWQQEDERGRADAESDAEEDADHES